MKAKWGSHYSASKHFISVFVLAVTKAIYGPIYQTFQKYRQESRKGKNTDGHRRRDNKVQVKLK
jgi:hypothetical protein